MSNDHLGLTQIEDAVIDDQSKIKSVSIDWLLGGLNYLSLASLVIDFPAHSTGSRYAGASLEHFSPDDLQLQERFLPSARTGN